MTARRTGLRERKKLATRRAIRRAALDLFDTQGYAATTVEQIAAAADVSPMTFYRHFGTKEATVISIALTDELSDALEALRGQGAVAGNATGMPTADAVLSLLGPLMERQDDEALDDLAARAALVAGTPELTDALWRQSSTWTQTVAHHLPATGLAARAQARALTGAVLEALLAWPTLPGFPARQVLLDCVAQALEAISAPVLRTEA